MGSVDTMKTSEIGIPLFEDHKMARTELRHLIQRHPGLKVLGESANGCETIEQVRLLHTDVVIMDIHLGGEDGIDVSKVVLARRAQADVSSRGAIPGRFSRSKHAQVFWGLTDIPLGVGGCIPGPKANSSV